MATKKTALPETWEEFCQQTGRDPLVLPDTTVYDERDKKHAVADFKLMHMIRHVNGEEVDHTNSGQIKYEIWWQVIKKEVSPSGLGLSFFGYDGWGTGTLCGPRLCFLDVPTLKWAAKAWLSLFEDYYL